MHVLQLFRASGVACVLGLAACGGKVATVDTPCASGPVGADEIAVTASCGATTTDGCGGAEADPAAAREALATKLRTCFTTSIPDVSAIVPAAQLDGAGCLASFTWLGPDAGLEASKACVEQALAASPRWSCLAAPACAAGRTVVSFAR